MRKISRLAVIMLALGAALVLCAYIQVNHLPNVLQYAVSAPQSAGAPSAAGDPDALESGGAVVDSPLLSSMRSIREFMDELSDYVCAYTLTGYAPDVSVGGDAGISQAADLYAISEGHFSVYPSLISGGRLLSDEELKYGDRVALLSSQLAVDLFRLSDPTGRKIDINGEEYVVAGVIRRDKQVEDASIYAVYLPLRALAAAGTTELQTLTLSALPISGAGAEIAVDKAAQAWRPNGNFYQVGREKVRALLFPRVLIALIWLYALVRLFKVLSAWAARSYHVIQNKLKLKYLPPLLPEIAARIALFAVLLSVLLLLFGLLWQFAIRPVLLFPEWVPEVPVEWSYIEKTFWILRYAANRHVQYVTGEVLRLRFFAMMADTGAVIALIGLCLQFTLLVRNRRIVLKP